MQQDTTLFVQAVGRPCKRGIVALGLALFLAAGASAEPLTVSESFFSCLKTGTKVRNTYIKHADSEKLKKAVSIFQSSTPDRQYPVGTVLQIIPSEAMVKHPKDQFPETNGWEFFFLELSPQGTKIASRGRDVVNGQGAKCLSCHQPAQNFDFVCEKGHGCAPIPFTDAQLAAIQDKDPRCARKEPGVDTNPKK